MRMLHRLLLLVAAPIAVMMLFSTKSFVEAFSERNAASSTLDAVEEAEAASALVHFLQRERGASVGLIATNDARFANELPTIRGNVDMAAEHLTALTGWRVGADNLRRLRNGVDNRSWTVPELTDAYTNMIVSLFDFIEDHLRQASDDGIETSANAYLSFIWAKEYAGRERTVGAIGFSQRFSEARYETFIALQEAQKYHLEQARKYSANTAATKIDDLTSSSATKRVSAYRELARKSAFDGVNTVSGPEWFSVATAMIDEMKAVEDVLSEALLVTAQSVSSKQLMSLLLVGLLSTVAIIVSIGITIYYATGISKQLGQLAIVTTKIAGGRFETKIPGVRRKDEIGAIAKSLLKFRDDAQKAEDARRIAVFKGSAFDGSSHPMVMTDRDLNVVFINDGTKKHFEENRSEFETAAPGFDPIGNADSSAIIFKSFLDDKKALLSDPLCLPLREDINIGELIISVCVSAVFDEDGAYCGYMIEWKNVSNDRRNAAIIKAIDMNQAMIEFKPSGEIVTANKNFTDTVKYELNDIIGKYHRIFCDPAYVKTDDYADMWHRLASGEAINGKFKRYTKDGSEVWIRASYCGVIDNDGSVRRVIKLASDITATEQERIKVEAERHRQEDEINRVVNSLASSLTRLSDGDLTSQISEPFADAYEQIRSNYNNAIDRLQTSIVSVVQNTDSIRTGASEISQAADDLSRRTENQAATLEQTAASLEEITASVRVAADGAEQANQVVAEARENAESSGVIVREAVGAMGEIEQSSQQISQIIGVIDDIAFQTNLLALNAGVEAARAGDAGRGFAVVASEVRALAQRSSDAAKEIKDLISASSQQVDRGVDLVGQTGQALERLVASVASISDRVSEIASGAREQSTSIAEINVAINQMDQVTQQNAAMVEQSTAASHALMQDTEQLNGVVSHFQVGDRDENQIGIENLAPSNGNLVHNQQRRIASLASSTPQSRGANALDINDPDVDWGDF
ncbi:MAG: methyl-accepting chemotaxis protein [Pseudomonadota bacterium]